MSFKKVIIHITTVTLSVLLSTSSLVASTETKRVLPLKEAIQSATNTSIGLKLLEKKIDTDQYILDTSKTDLPSDYDLAYSLRDQQQSATYFKHKLEYLTEQKYNALITSDLNLDLLDQQIALIEQDIKALKIKESHGASSSLALKNKQAELDKLNHSKTSALAEQESLKKDFQKLTNLDPDRYILENPVQFEPFRAKNSIDAYIYSRIDEMQTYTKEQAKYFEATVGVRSTIPSSNEISESAYASNVYQKQALSSNLTLQRDTYYTTLLAQYTNLINLEQQIENIKNELELLDKQLKLTEIRLNAGQTTQLEYDRLLAQKDQLNYNLTVSYYQYEDLKQVLDKPWVFLS